MAKRTKRLKAKFNSSYNFNTHAHHLNLNSKPLCERLLQVFSEGEVQALNRNSRTDNPANITCTFCLLAWDAINDLGIKMKWPVAMYGANTGWVVIPLPHYVTVVHHAEKIINLMGGIETIRKSKDVWVYEAPPKPVPAKSVAEELAAASIDAAQGRE